MEKLLLWHHLVFYISVIVGILLAIGSAFGLHLGDFDHDLGGDQDVDADSDHDYNEHQNSTVLDSSPRMAKEKSSVWKRFLAAFGFGRAPIIIVLMLFSLCFGGIGMISNQVMENFYPEFFYAPISFIVAFIGTMFMVGVLTRLVAKYVPSVETYAIQQGDMLGKTGVLIVSTSSKFGMVQIDMGKDLLQMQCRSEGETLPEGEKVIVTKLHKENNVLVVAKRPS